MDGIGREALSLPRFIRGRVTGLRRSAGVTGYFFLPKIGSVSSTGSGPVRVFKKGKPYSYQTRQKILVEKNK
jgi:hypothetical protein